MKAKDFVQHVAALMPPRKALQALGLDDDDLENIQAGFMARRRPASGGPRRSEVERLISEFDCSTLEIGRVQFNGQLISHPAGSCFAYDEADPLVVMRDGRIALCDHAVPDSVHQLCARDGRAFLEAMAIVATLIAERDAWVGRFDEAATRCAEAAGGPEYAGFFRPLCGFLLVGEGE